MKHNTVLVVGYKYDMVSTTRLMSLSNLFTRKAKKHTQQFRLIGMKDINPKEELTVMIRLEALIRHYIHQVECIGNELLVRKQELEQSYIED